MANSISVCVGDKLMMAIGNLPSAVVSGVVSGIVSGDASAAVESDGFTLSVDVDVDIESSPHAAAVSRIAVRAAIELNLFMDQSSVSPKD